MDIIVMPSLQDTMQEYQDMFSFLEDPMDKFAQIIDMGKTAKGLTAEERNENNRITGCASQAWVVCSSNGDQTVIVRTDSDAHIVRGLLHILETVLSGRTFAEIDTVEASDILNNIGLNRSITSQRTNGFISAITKIKGEIRELEIAE